VGTLLGKVALENALKNVCVLPSRPVTTEFLIARSCDAVVPVYRDMLYLQAPGGSLEREYPILTFKTALNVEEMESTMANTTFPGWRSLDLDFINQQLSEGSIEVRNLRMFKNPFHRHAWYFVCDSGYILPVFSVKHSYDCVIPN
jgi:hypothetical protein